MTLEGLTAYYNKYKDIIDTDRLARSAYQRALANPAQIDWAKRRIDDFLQDMAWYIKQKEQQAKAKEKEHQRMLSPGDMFIRSSGSYSDYEVYGLFKVIKPFNPYDMYEASQASKLTYEALLLKEGFIEELKYLELNTESRALDITER